MYSGKENLLILNEIYGLFKNYNTFFYLSLIVFKW